MALASLKPKLVDGIASVELVDQVQARRVELAVNLGTRKLTVRVLDHIAQPRMAIGADVSSTGLAGFFEWCERAANLYGENKLMSADELLRQLADDDLTTMVQPPRRKR